MPIALSSSSARAPRPSARWLHSLVRPWVFATLLLAGPGCSSEAAPGRTPPASSAPQPRDSLQEEVFRLLDGSEPLPREADWVPLGPEALTVLTSLASDSRSPEPQRARAVAAMAVVAHPDASQRLQELLESRAVPASVRAAATLALGRLAGLQALPLLAPLLEDGSEHVRAAAALALGRVGGGEARRRLEERLSSEESLVVREALQQGLVHLEP